MKRVVFLLNLLQDVNILRPLVRLVALELQAPVLLLVTAKFIDRDTQGVWQAEVDELRTQTGAPMHVYHDAAQALQHLAGHAGVIVAASETNLVGHAETHAVFRAAPPGYLRVTLQHGFECVGFLQNRDHSKAHGRNVTFAADVICGWCALERMTAVAPSERAKFLATGPSALLEAPPERTSGAAPGPGIVCENLHSVRLRTSGDARPSFMQTFNAFCAELAQEGERVALRPHPGGQYVLKNNVPLPENVVLENRPIYKVDLRDHAFGLSAPSSVVIDMVLAGVPAAVWQDEGETVDTTHYEGLTVVCTLAEWLAFRRDALLRPEVFARRQARYLQHSGLITDAALVHTRFGQLLAGGLAAAPP